jgi:hypothetical protein
VQLIDSEKRVDVIYAIKRVEEYLMKLTCSFKMMVFNVALIYINNVGLSLILLEFILGHNIAFSIINENLLQPL